MVFRGLLLFLLLISSVFAIDEERKLEAAFLGRFGSYIEIPPKDASKFTIVLIDKNPFGTMLESLYKDKRIQNRKVEVRYATKIEDIGKCDLLFVTLDTVKSREEAINYARKNSILSISEAKGFAEAGGIIQLTFVEQRIQIKINHEAALKSGIKIAATLLSLSTVVRGVKK